MVVAMGQHIARCLSRQMKQSFPLALTFHYVIVHRSVDALIRSVLHCNASHDVALVHATLPHFDKGFLLQLFLAVAPHFHLTRATIRYDNRFLG